MFIRKLACGFAAALCVASGSAWADNLAVTSVPGYEILEYLESSGTQYIDTGIVYANDTKLSQRFCIVDFAGAQMQMGALDNVEWVTTRPGSWLIEAWRDKIGRRSTLLSVVILIGLYIFVGSRYQVEKTISLSFSPSGEPLEEISAVNMLVVPLAATFIFVIGTVTGLFLFQNKENRRLAELMWGSVTAAVLQCLAAAIMIF